MSTSTTPTHHISPLSNVLARNDPLVNWSTISATEKDFFSSRSRGLPLDAQREDLKTSNVISAFPAFVYRLRPPDAPKGSLGTDSVDRSFYILDKNIRCDTGINGCPAFRVTPSGPLKGRFSADGERLTISHITNGGFTTIKRADGSDAMFKGMIIQRFDLPKSQDMESYAVQSNYKADVTATGIIHYICEDSDDDDQGLSQEAGDTHTGVGEHIERSRNQYSTTRSRGFRKKWKAIKGWTVGCFGQT
ncbi:hypothetical protein I302_102911 [Kwoniella bestiolae CBS 10118]|uniref:Uncharacterized protein n=1 Tax=Kwoniella bestiolae CBS 10118 TaxID=1296100 RepID=A0A1B9GGC4_9TREE|nr:hypothetical protein I302_01608 [Kwoniella bestiolae CBS 10118]OCF30089.1 hypothetical protein I302_01608 [Kwoniella bestiolae CBS 10118]